MFRIVQECLTNVARHAGATHVHVRIARADRDVIVTVADDGAGFEPVRVGKTSHGLLGIRERAYLLGGQVELVSAPGEGTTLEVRIPHSERVAWP